MKRTLIAGLLTMLAGGAMAQQPAQQPAVNPQDQFAGFLAQAVSKGLADMVAQSAQINKLDAALRQANTDLAKLKVESDADKDTAAKLRADNETLSAQIAELKKRGN